MATGPHNDTSKTDAPVRLTSSENSKAKTAFGVPPAAKIGEPFCNAASIMTTGGVLRPSVAPPDRKSGLITNKLGIGPVDSFT